MCLLSIQYKYPQVQFKHDGLQSVIHHALFVDSSCQDLQELRRSPDDLRDSTEDNGEIQPTDDKVSTMLTMVNFLPHLWLDY